MNVAGDMGYNKQNPINKDFMELVDAGVIVSSTDQAAPRLTNPRPETPATPTTDGGDEIDAAFAAAKASGEEPEPEFATGERSKSNVTISDEDFQSWMKYKELSDRLTSVKSNLLKAKRYRSTPGDINDVGSTAREIKGLTDLKASLEQRIEDLVSKSEYLQKDIAKKTGKELPPPIENPLEDEEDAIDEGVMHRMQYYAGIKK